MNEMNLPAERARRRRLVVIGIGVLAVLVALGVWISRRDPAPSEVESAEKTEAADGGEIELDAETQERIGLETEEARVRPLSTLIRTSGVIAPNETRLARMRPLSTGVVTSVLVKRGDRVAAGQALLTYDNVDLGQTQAEFRSATGALETARGQAEVARLALERADRLVEIGGIAQAEQQRRKADYAAAMAAVRSAEANVANLRQKLRRYGVGDAAANRGTDARSATALRAPFAGVVLDVQTAGGESVSPERELLTIADLSTVWVLGDIYERDLSRVTVRRDAMLFTEAYPDQPVGCRLTNISDLLDPQTRTAKVRCEARNPGGRLRLQMFARLEIPAAPREVLAVPRQAVQQLDGRPTVFVRTGDKTFEPRTVALGVITDDWTEITAGLTAGARVVTTGAAMLKSRMKVSDLKEDDDHD